jgi:hypothetical protein
MTPLDLDIAGAVGQNAAGPITLPTPSIVNWRLCQQHFKLT